MLKTIALGGAALLLAGAMSVVAYQTAHEDTARTARYEHAEASRQALARELEQHHEEEMAAIHQLAAKGKHD